MQVVGDHRAEVVITSASEGGATLDAAALAVLPPAIARRVVRLVAAESPRAWHCRGRIGGRVRPRRRPASGGPLDLPGLTVERRDRCASFAGFREPGRAAVWAGSPTGRARCCVGRAETGVDDRASYAGRRERAMGRDARVGRGAPPPIPTAAVRQQPPPGDRFRPLGAPGRASCRTCSSTGKCPALSEIGCRVVVDASGPDSCGWSAWPIAEDCRVGVARVGRGNLGIKKGNL